MNEAAPQRVVGAGPSSDSGTVTFVFTDIEASTARWERDAPAMGDALRRHDAIVQGVVAEHAGTVFKTIGDAFCIAFPRAGSALACAVGVQRALATADFSQVGGLRVRVAIHTGTAEARDGDYFGPTLNRVSRLLAIAHGGQTILSSAAASLAREALPPGTQLDELGTHRLKDLREPEDVYQCTIDELPNEFPPLNSISERLGNLPLALSQFVGRREALTDLRGLLAEHRTVTIVGAGGVGKTRISLELGAALQAKAPDGVWFVDLAPVPEASYLASAFAATLGVRVGSEDDGELLRATIAAIARKKLVIIADNCEHVIDAAAHTIAAIVRGAPDVRILATSREALRIPGEHVYRLPSLAHPPGDVRSSDEALGYEAIALFVQRAKATGTTFEITDANAASIGEICRRLDGIPLAIELAAARMNVLSPAQIVARLDERFRMLGGTRAVLPRQKTMRALIDWSYDILTDVERTVVRRLAVFVGGWTLEWAAKVCEGDGLDTLDVADIVLALVEKSLVGITGADDSKRFTFPESIRLYMLEKLEESQEARRIERRHAETIAEAVRVIAEISRSRGPSIWNVSLRADLDNLRTAIDWSFGPRGDAMLGARIVSDSYVFLLESRFRAQCRRYFETANAAIDATREPEIAAKLQLATAMISPVAERLAGSRRALDLASGVARYDLAALARTQIGYVLMRMGRNDEGEAELRGALETLSDHGMAQTWQAANLLDSLASAIFTNVSRDGAAEATTLYSDASTIFGRLEDPIARARIDSNLAYVQFAAGDAESALRRALDAVNVFASVGSLVREAEARLNIAAYLIALGRFGEARESALAAITIARASGESQVVTAALEHIARIMAEEGESEGAARYLGYADARFAQEQLVRDPIDMAARIAVEVRLRERLGDETLARYFALGAQMNEDTAVADALDRHRSTAATEHAGSLTGSAFRA